VPPVRQAGGVPPSYAFRRRVREALVRAGIREAICYSFASTEDLDLMGHGPDQAVRVANPLTSDQAFLRTSLIPGLVRSLRANLSRSVRGAALFEVGRTFTANGEPGEDRSPPVVEQEGVAFVMGGASPSASPGEARDLDFFDAKGALEEMFGALGVRDWRLGAPATAPYHPARSATVELGGEDAGAVGELHPRVAEQLDLPARTSIAQLDAAYLADAATHGFEYRDVPRFPPVHRDLAFVVDERIAAGELRDALAAAGAELVSDVRLFDVFSGAPIPPGRKSLAFSVDFRATDRTLTDQEVDSTVEAIESALGERFGAELRRS
jgi:phenylalanyl-tRNA synthetase beta chain